MECMFVNAAAEFMNYHDHTAAVSIEVRVLPIKFNFCTRERYKTFYGIGGG